MSTPMLYAADTSGKVGTMPRATVPKAYRYARFSHSRQAEGMSLERQADVAEEWARQRGIPLDDTLAAFVDAGVSASRGKNIVKGALGRFRESVAAGDIAPGSYLLVESVSRFSRLSPLDSQPILRELVEAGIKVVFFDPSIEVTAENQHDMAVGMIFQIMAYIAKEYAETLARYKSKAWERARESMRTDGKAVTRNLPYWLSCESVTDANGRKGRGPIELHPLYADVVRRIFREYLAGKGKAQIAAGLEADNVPPPVRVGYKADKAAAFWRHGLIARTLANEAVTGVFQPHKEIKARITLKSGIAAALKQRREKVGEPIPDYFPRVISDADFQAVEALRARNVAKAGERLRLPGRGAISHILAGGLARCPVCDSAMLRSNKGKRLPPRYVCTKALAGKAGACVRHYVPVAEVEAALIGAADQLAAASPVSDPALAASLTGARAAHAAVATKLASLNAQIMAIMDKDDGEWAPQVMIDRLNALEKETETRKATLQALESKAAASATNVIRQRVASMCSALKGYGPGPLDFDVQHVNNALRDCFTRVVIDYRTGKLVVHWLHGPPPAVVRYGQA